MRGTRNRTSVGRGESQLCVYLLIQAGFRGTLGESSAHRHHWRLSDKIGIPMVGESRIPAFGVYVVTQYQASVGPALHLRGISYGLRVGPGTSNLWCCLRWKPNRLRWGPVGLGGSQPFWQLSESDTPFGMY